MMSPPRVRRTRFVCIADTHNSQVKLPQGDVLIHAGDLTNQGSFSELSRTVSWLESAPFERKFVVAGNHDMTLDRAFYARSGSRFHSQSPQSPDACLGLLQASASITYLCHSTARVQLTSSAGPRTQFTLFGSPYSPGDGQWAFQYAYEYGSGGGCGPADDAVSQSACLWESIPADVDIVVTHTPPLGHCDGTAVGRGGGGGGGGGGEGSRTTEAVRGRQDRQGCGELSRTLGQRRPRLAVCGHVHEGRGAERIMWAGEREGADQAETREKAAWASVERWQDPAAREGTKKLSLVDLTQRGGRALDWTDRTDGTDRESSAEGTGRRETCVVNCAITATSYPHRGGKRLNKPIVVDLELPVWEGDV